MNTQQTEIRSYRLRGRKRDWETDKYWIRWWSHANPAPKAFPYPQSLRSRLGSGRRDSQLFSKWWAKLPNSPKRRERRKVCLCVCVWVTQSTFHFNPYFLSPLLPTPFSHFFLCYTLSLSFHSRRLCLQLQRLKIILFCPLFFFLFFF